MQKSHSGQAFDLLRFSLLFALFSFFWLHFHFRRIQLCLVHVSFNLFSDYLGHGNPNGGVCNQATKS